MNMIMKLKEILNRNRNKKLMIGAGLLVALAVSLGWFNQGTETETAKAERGDIQKYMEEVGEVTCRDSTTVFLEGSGLIRNIYVEENQPVKKGDPLMSLDQAQMDIAVQNAREALSGARARCISGEEAYQTALKDFSNTKYLAEEGAASQWELTQKEAALKSAGAVRAAYQSELEQAELNLENCSIALGKQQIVSPIDGTVLEKNVELNELGAPGTAAFVIGNGEDVEIESSILADDAADIQIGDEAEIITRTEEQQVIRGVVAKIAPTATEEISSLGVKQKKVAVTVRPLDPAISLKVGSEADVRVITDTKRGVIIIPAGAVFDFQGESCVFTVESGKAVIRPVERGIRNQSFAEIKKGLREGDVVISAPDNSIEAGMRIRPVRTKL